MEAAGVCVTMHSARARICTITAVSHRRSAPAKDLIPDRWCPNPSVTEPYIIAVINYNTRDELRSCLESLQPCLNRVIVFDNYSMDGSADMVRGEFPAASLIESPENLGYGAAANRVFLSHPLARNAEFLILANSDIVFGRGSIDALVDDLRRHADAGLTGPRLLNTDGSLQRSCFPLPGSIRWILDNDDVCVLLQVFPLLRGRLLRLWEHDTEREVPSVKGALLAIRRTAFEDVGGFDEFFFMYYEETDLCIRLANRGWRIRFTPSSQLIHVGAASTTKESTAMAAELFASSMRFARRHYSWLHSTLLLQLWRLIFVTRLARARWAIVSRGDRAARSPAMLQTWRRAISFRFRDLERRDDA